MPRITKRTVDALTPHPGRDVQLMDDALAGFGVRMKPSGAASYFVRYRTPDGAARRLVLGKVGALTPDEARKLAREKFAEIAKGADPSAERHRKLKAMSVAEICDWYLSAAADGEILGRRGERIKSSTLKMDRSRIDSHVRRLLGSRPADALTDTDIVRMQRDIAAGKTAKARVGRGGVTTGGAGVAARTVRMLGAILEHARKARLVTANPARGVTQLAEGQSERRLSESEVTALGTAILAAELAGANPVPLAAVRYLLMTGFRRAEVLGMRLAAVDAKNRCVTLAETKSGRQVRAVGVAALSVLDDLPRADDAVWVFPAEHGAGHFVGLPKVLERLYAVAGIEGATVHTLRHTFASVAADLGFTEMTVAALLGHARRGVTQRYAKVDRAAVLAADTVAAHMARLMNGSATTAEVVPLTRRAG